MNETVTRVNSQNVETGRRVTFHTPGTETGLYNGPNFS